MTHSLLERQLRKAAYDTDALMDLVSAAYEEYERALKRQEHAMRLTSAELTEKNADLNRAKEQAESLNVAKGDVVAKMMQELRSTLGAMLGATRMLLESDLGQDQKELAEIVEKCSTRLLDLIKDLFGPAKIEG
jgi:signal transduction histidine kinase